MKKISLTPILIASFLLSSCQPAPQEVKETRLYMGTIVEITVFGPDTDRLTEAKDAAFAEIERIEHLMSSYRDDSDVSLIDASAGGPAVVVDPEVYTVIERSIEISRLSDGAFDITMAVLHGVWKIDPDNPRLGSPEEIADRLPLISWKGVILDPERHAVGLAKPGMKIDLGGIAKGYAVDRAIEAIAEKGVTMALINAGGDLRALGQRPGRPWQIGIQDPREQGAIIGSLPVINTAVATSGDYEKFFIRDGKRYCHILDPRTGNPVSSCQSVTIITPEAWKADALATSVFVLGPGKGLALVERLPGVEAIIIDAQGRVFETPGVKGRVNWLKQSP
jgi:thiamine biosynthesis lipoprotein